MYQMRTRIVRQKETYDERGCHVERHDRGDFDVLGGILDERGGGHEIENRFDGKEVCLMFSVGRPSFFIKRGGGAGMGLIEPE